MIPPLFVIDRGVGNYYQNNIKLLLTSVFQCCILAENYKHDKIREMPN